VYSLPNYNFAYQVHDSKSGSNHGHSEFRNGDAVHGQYTVLDPDGILRIVSYTSDPGKRLRLIQYTYNYRHIPIVFRTNYDVAF
jgi:hypothetical protein